MAKYTINEYLRQAHSSLEQIEKELAEQKSVKTLKVVDLTVDELKQIIREVVREEINKKTFPDYSIPFEPYVPPTYYKEPNPYRPAHEVWCGDITDITCENKENIDG